MLHLQRLEVQRQEVTCVGCGYLEERRNRLCKTVSCVFHSSVRDSDFSQGADGECVSSQRGHKNSSVSEGFSVLMFAESCHLPWLLDSMVLRDALSPLSPGPPCPLEFP